MDRGHGVGVDTEALLKSLPEGCTSAFFFSFLFSFLSSSSSFLSFFFFSSLFFIAL